MSTLIQRSRFFLSQAVNNPEVSTAKKMKKNRNRKKAVRDDRLKRKKKTKISVYEHKD